jgi:hypothetical protein
VPSRSKTAELGDIVDVTWRDAWCETTEQQLDEFDDDIQNRTMGRMVRYTRSLISVAPEEMGVEPDDVPLRSRTWRGVTHIPRCLVIEVRVIEKGGG